MRTIPLQSGIDKALRKNVRATPEERELQREAVDLLIGTRKTNKDYSHYVEMEEENNGNARND